MNATFTCRTLGIGLLVLMVTGCGGYTVTFHPDRVINAPSGMDAKHEMLVVDIVLLTKEDAKQFRDIANGTMRCDEWFRARMSDDSSIRGIPSTQIYALRQDNGGGRHDVRVGDPLVDGMTLERGGQGVGSASRSVEIEPLPGLEQIVIFANWQSALGSKPPLRVPTPKGGKEYQVEVGRDSMRLID